jgi:DNA primase
MSLPADFLDELRARVGLAAVVGRRVKLTRAGRELKGCCPFHNEKTPSFYVNEDKGFYHCFGCGAHGDAIGFVMAQDGLSFIEAVKSLAAEAGLSVPERQREDPEAERRAGLSDLLSAAADWYRAQLAAVGGSAARAYLERRGVAPELQALFGLGFAPDARDALSKALAAKYPTLEPDQLLDAGLAGQAEDRGQPSAERRYDRFRGRLMFPIHDARGRTVGFGGRALGDVEPKYLNSPEGPVFHKGRLLYNLHRAAPPARKAGRLLIVEGYMDVVGLAGAGIAEAVAPLGTALTEEQLALAWRLVPEPCLAFDGDGAGLRAAARAASRALPLVGAGRSLAFVTLPAGKDPDDLARSGGRPAIEALLQSARPLERFLFEAEAASGPLDTPERRAAFRARLKALAGEIADPDVRRDYLRTWMDRADALFRRPPRAAGPARSPRDRRGWQLPPTGALAETRAAAGQPIEFHMGALLKLISSRPNLAESHAEALVELPLQSPALARARDRLLAGSDAGQLLAGYRALSFEGEEAGTELDEPALSRHIARTLASCLASHHMSPSDRQAPDRGPGESLEDAFERNRAAALALLQRTWIGRSGMTSATDADKDQA